MRRRLYQTLCQERTFAHQFSVRHYECTIFSIFLGARCTGGGCIVSYVTLRVLMVEEKAQPPNPSPTVNVGTAKSTDPPDTGISRGLRIGKMQGTK